MDSPFASRPAQTGTPVTRPYTPTPRPVTNQPAAAAALQKPVAAYPAAGAAAPPRRGISLPGVLGCLLRVGLVLAFIAVVAVLCIASLGIYQYNRIASTLPDIADLRQKASHFETTRILDRNGDLLYELMDPNAGKRTYVPLSKISPYLVAATIATEDKDFYSHPGFDPTAIVRAFWQNYSSGETVSGASTITQQLARTLLFTPEERTEQSYRRKIREAILAVEITRRYSKDDILELYLNENNFGNLAYGVEAAAETYFGTSADKLSLAQSAFLAGIPQAPSIYDVYTRPDATFSRMQDVLILMYQTSQEQGCIYVSNQPQRVCLDPVKVTQAVEEIKNYPFKLPENKAQYPHWVDYIRALLESQIDPQTIYREGYTVYTTIDPVLQQQAEQIVRDQVNQLKANHATDGALIALRPSTGEILAMVGSADYYNEAIAGQVNMAINPRQPGSSIKPLTYLAAFEKGWTPSTLIWDVPSEFTPSGKPDDPSPKYIPVNYDGRFHGPVTVRTALANSYNLPAVKTLNYVGIYDDPNTPQPDGFINLARRMGISTLDRPDYGLSLTLGGGDVTLLDLTSAYATLANGGRRLPPVAVLRIVDKDGKEVYKYSQPAGDQVVRPEHAYLITSILSDNDARTPAFGANSVLHLPFQAAAKTGTTNDFRDNWTLGYTPDLATGVWVGNADYTPMQNTTGLTGAAPIWSQYMQTAVPLLTAGNPTPFTRPGGIVDYVICAISGTQPSEWCPSQRSEIFAGDQPPLPKEQDLWQKVVVDTWTGLLASHDCPDFTDERFVLNVKDEWAQKWLKKDAQGKAWAEAAGFPKGVTFAPSRECKADDPRPILQINSPRKGETILDNPLSILGVANATKWFDYWRLDYGIGDNPVEWQTIEQGKRPVDHQDLLTDWYLDDFLKKGITGPITLRLYLHSTEDTKAELHTLINMQVPSPTPTATATPTSTPLPTQTPLPSETPTPTFSPPPTTRTDPDVDPLSRRDAYHPGYRYSYPRYPGSIVSLS